MTAPRSFIDTDVFVYAADESLEEQVKVPLVLAAVDTCAAVRISPWDTLMIEAARQADCWRILTENLSPGQVIRDVTVENPFQPAVPGPR